MYPPPSPIFDVPELPATLRRVKPLPKRRRTSDPTSHDDHGFRTSSPAPGMGTGVNTPQESHDGADDNVPATPDPTFAAQMALQAYYGPVLGGVRDLFKNMPTPDRGRAGEDDASRTSTPISIDLSAALAAGFGTGAGWYGSVVGGLGGLGGGYEQDDEDGDGGDYVDHLQQPGNTKKRKVPANMSGSAHGHDGGSGGSGAEDEAGDRAMPTGRERDVDAVAGGVVGAGTGGGGGGGGGAHGSLALAGKKGRLSRATLAGLQHKAMLRSRKRQLATVLGTLAHGDTLALDQALSAHHIFVQPHTRVHLSRRRTSRFARALKAYMQSHPPGEGEGESKENEVPSSDFTFVFHSATSERLVATNGEVAELHGRFQAELARQAAKAAEAAKQAAAALSGPLAKRTNGTKQAPRTTAGKGSDAKGTLEQSLLGTKGKGGKKKKRSALANASNPHHLRNYVPSRLPHSGPPSAQQAMQNAQNLLTPLPLRFLSAEIPPRRRKKSEPNVTPVSTLTNPAEEWICPFCEYQLFYGDDQSYARAVRNRKKILRRRRRARERAAAAASGATAAAAAEKAQDDEVHPGFETPAPLPVAKETPPAAGKQAKWKEGDRGGHGVAAQA
ncbi:hypothetical protein BD309DRAFT_467644 [Dichomitus squalens]|uniref:Uncharacterized protein n=1 Tax=Dichomitus squalens TaxID=114155 RepID=A0A4Q9P020_9APHY|nr:hypothetical protein BD309DRAFT_467644 [Dichomitus squalens]TBU60581.1 hypothetical protein BD310DRAFT_323384 [Dichomitus squalens]